MASTPPVPLMALHEPAAGNAPLSADLIHVLVRDFYADVRHDPLLGPVFEAAIGSHWDAHLQRMEAFWRTVGLGEKGYKGSLLQKHKALTMPAADHDITPAHFAAWVRLWAQHTERLLAPEPAQVLQRAAHGVGRQLFRTMLGTPAPFDTDRAKAHAAEHSVKHP